MSPWEERRRRSTPPASARTAQEPVWDRALLRRLAVVAGVDEATQRNVRRLVRELA